MATWSAEALPLPRPDPGTRLALGFALTIFTSAFLLFQVEPLISKAILPWFGGSPAVWTTCLLFFQTLLFAGYAYAHLSTRLCPPRVQALLHLGLVALALVLMPLSPGAHGRPSGDADPTLGVLALVSYPFVFEPAFTTETLARLWSWLFAGYAGLLAVLAWPRLRLEGSAPGLVSGSIHPDAVAPTWRARTLWVALPAFASVLLLATTNHVCENVAVIPFLWVAPLALYLLSFVIAFDGPRWYARRGFAVAGVVLALAVGCVDPLDDLLGAVGLRLGFRELLLLDFGLLFVVCMLCHGELVRLRPSSDRLTEFYLLVAFGGALGGLLVSVVCPAVFSTFLEWSLGSLVAFGLSAAVLFAATPSPAWRSATGRVAVGLLLALGLAGIGYCQIDDDPPLAEARNFYGTIAVYDVDPADRAAHHYSLMHGMVVHGRQFRAPEKQDLPLAYYAPRSGVGRALEFFASAPDLRVGAVGLGVGTLAHYAHPGQHLTFYEINPAVIRFAEKYFTYLSHCGPACDLVLGDARLSLERQEPQNFHVLVLDAFSGDAVPTHLLTRQALDTYQKHLRPDGVIAVNITNRQLDLAPVLEGLAEHGGFKTIRVFSPDDGPAQLFHADWMLLTKNERFIRATPPAPPPTLPKPKPKRPLLWTDSFSNLFQLLK